MNSKSSPLNRQASRNKNLDIHESLSRLSKPSYMKMNHQTARAYESFVEVFDSQNKLPKGGPIHT